MQRLLYHHNPVFLQILYLFKNFPVGNHALPGGWR